MASNEKDILMNGDEKVLLGEIKGIVKTIRDEHGRQLGELFDLGRKTNGHVTENTTRLNEHHGRIKRIEAVVLKAIFVGILIAVSVLGVDKLIERIAQ